MHPATFALIMNVALAALFATSYVTIALLYRQERAPLWFAASYAVGMLTPLGQLGLGYGGWPLFFGAVIYFSFSGALLLMVPALAVFYRRPIPWRLVAFIAVVTLAMAALLRHLPRDTIGYTAAYQVPFMLATAASTREVLRDSPRRGGDLVLAALFGLTAAHFPVKAVLAASLGTGADPSSYISSTYALVSQVGTGILLVATGLALLINAVLAVTRDMRDAAEQDPLSGVLNRRGFEERAEAIVAAVRRGGEPAALLLLDIDYFKRINDTLGHAGGDRAIRWFGAMLADRVPQSAVVGRLGGEEFGILLERTSRETARLQAEAIRAATSTHGAPDVPDMTVSIGVTDLRAGDLLHSALERADAALYAAKRDGRNRVRLAPEAPGPWTGNVVALRRPPEA